MIYNLEFVVDHGLYQLNTDVLAFFERAQEVNKFAADILFTETLNNVINESSELSKKFREVFKLLNAEGIDKARVYNYLRHNNEIVDILTNTEFEIIDLPDTYNDLKLKIFALFEHLWKNTIGTVCCDNNYGSIDDHYQLFYQLNESKRICAFCGLEKVKRAKEQRNEYDHYLNKSLFKWAAINFLNLVPMCGNCNKRPNKGSKIMIYFDNTTTRRLAYHPYASVLPVNVTIDCKNIFAANENWDITIGTPHQDQRFETWKDVFRIDFRYKTAVEEDYKNWLIDLYADIGNDLPQNIAELRNTIEGFLNKRQNSSKKPGDLIEFSFWRFLMGAQDFDLNLILNHLRERHSIMAA